MIYNILLGYLICGIFSLLFIRMFLIPRALSKMSKEDSGWDDIWEEARKRAEIEFERDLDEEEFKSLVFRQSSHISFNTAFLWVLLWPKQWLFLIVNFFNR